MIKFITATLLTLASALAFAAVDINKATPAELETIKGIGPSMSSRIVAERQKGAFKDWTDLQGRVKGIGDGNAKKFSADGLTVGGTPYAMMVPPSADKAKGKKAKSEKTEKAAKAVSVKP